MATDRPACIRDTRSQSSTRETRALRLSVIIVSWNVQSLLRESLLSLDAHMQMPKDDYEVLVVDNCSHDGSAEMIRREFPSVTLFANDVNCGFGAANNQAFAQSRGETVLLLNPDTVVLPGGLDPMVHYLENHANIGAIGCRLLNTDGSLQRWTAGATPTVWRAAVHAFFLDKILPDVMLGRRLHLMRDIRQTIDVNWLSGACLALRRKAVSDGLFDERYFMYGEDLELCHRLAARGWRIVYFPDVAIIHHHGKSTAQSENAQLAGLKGPRDFLGRSHGRMTVAAWDVVTALGFALRTVGWAMLSLSGRAHARHRVAVCWQFTRASVRVLTGR